MAPVSQVEPGSISHGTLREEDLITAFLGELRRLDPERAKAAEDLHMVEAAEMDADSREWLLTFLFDTLEEYAPEDCYFGAHVGDGSDFGFWPVEAE
jgi:hypothetical protein